MANRASPWRTKCKRLLAAGVTPIVCVGEQLEERESGATEDIVAAQLDCVLEEVEVAHAAHGSYCLRASVGNWHGTYGDTGASKRGSQALFAA